MMNRERVKANVRRRFGPWHVPPKFEHHYRPRTYWVPWVVGRVRRWFR